MSYSEELYQMGCQLLELIDPDNFNKLDDRSKHFAVCIALSCLVSKFFNYVGEDKN